ncbi:MAG: hypothetical protein AAF483_10100 [Planctomycetota bacterium]
MNGYQCVFEYYSTKDCLIDVIPGVFELCRIHFGDETWEDVKGNILNECGALLSSFVASRDSDFLDTGYVWVAKSIGRSSPIILKAFALGDGEHTLTIDLARRDLPLPSDFLLKGVEVLLPDQAFVLSEENEAWIHEELRKCGRHIRSDESITILRFVHFLRSSLIDAWGGKETLCALTGFSCTEFGDGILLQAQCPGDERARVSQWSAILQLELTTPD